MYRGAKTNIFAEEQEASHSFALQVDHLNTINQEMRRNSNNVPVSGKSCTD